MIESRVAIKYATALFRTAKRTDQVESISHDLEALSGLLSKNVLLKSFVESPQVEEKDKKKLLTSTFKPLISEALFSFLMLVLSKHRIQYLELMTNEFQRLVKDDQGIVEARLVTARVLDPPLAEELRVELERTTGKNVEMKLEKDPSLIGGILIVLGDKIIDRSIRYQLGQLKDQMSALRVH
jgi:F-type H+-transporting ATPase subunit delta